MAPSSLPTYTLPWLTPQIKKKIHHRRNLFRKAKKSNSPSIRSAYKHLHNEISHDLSISKASFMHSLSTSNSCRFWSYIKLTQKSTASIPPLASSDNTFLLIKTKLTFSFFNHSLPPLDAPVPLHNDFFPSEFLCTPAHVSQLIRMLPSVTACLWFR